MKQMKELKKDRVIYCFSPDNPAVYEVEDGEEFWVEMDDCYSGQIKSEKDLRPNIDISIMDAAVGPIRIKGAKVGSALCVEIMDIKLAPQGVQVTSPGLGILGDRIKEPHTRIIPVKDGYAYFHEKAVVPVQPMIGVMGVAPAAGKYHCASPGDHGGNMDTKEIGIGSRVYLPVFVEGANLGVADMHARQGDGELSGTAIEIGGRARLRVKVLPDLKLNLPVVETEDYLIMVSSALDFNSAIKRAVSEMADLIAQKLDLPFADAYRLLSITCDIRISQVVNPLLTVKICLPKAITQIYSL